MHSSPSLAEPAFKHLNSLPAFAIQQVWFAGQENGSFSQPSEADPPPPPEPELASSPHPSHNDATTMLANFATFIAVSSPFSLVLSPQNVACAGSKQRIDA
jgi:hypothetical protein